MKGSQARILVVDDDPTVVLTLEAIFGKAGYDVLSTTDPRQALAALESATTPGEVKRLVSTWSVDETWKRTAGAGDGEDKREPRSDEPQFQFAADREAAIAAGALSP